MYCKLRHEFLLKPIATMCDPRDCIMEALKDERNA